MTGAELDEVLRALAHAERRFFIGACINVDRAAGELSDMSSLSLAAVSEHLKVLRKTGLLKLEVRGRFWMYRTDAGRLQRALSALQGSFQFESEGADGT